MKKEKGITIISLVVMIAILLILAGVASFSGMESAEATALQGFYTQMEIIQKRVDDIAQTNETYIINNSDGSETQVPLKEQGKILTENQITLLTSILNVENINAQPSSFKYFTVNDLKEKLDIPNIQYDVFIDFDNRIVVAEDGITVENKTYYVLNNRTYFVEHNSAKNEGNIEKFNYTISQYSGGKYKITVTPTNNIGDLEEIGYVKYKKTTSKYWETSTNTEIILELDIEYDITYIDNNNNSLEKRIKVEYIKDEQENQELTVTEVTD